MSDYSLMRRSQLSLDSFAAQAGMHPDLVRRLVTLGLLEPTQTDAATAESRTLIY
jgi:chaperone modulatory protein CbpM